MDYTYSSYKKKSAIFIVFSILFSLQLNARELEFSTAGFFEIPNSGREVFSMNPAWRFYKGNIKGAEKPNFDDHNWAVVSLPNGIEYLPTEASGCINYQGEVWYRKHFTLSDKLQNKKLFLHFEAIMGKSKIFVNGKLLSTHYGGYLPIVVDITNILEWGKDNVIAVWADNSDDSNYPPGKAQDVLDYTYFGGIYRDCWLVAHNNIFITDPNFENEIAGGGLFIAYDKISETSAEISLKLHMRNEKKEGFKGTIEYELRQPDGMLAASLNRSIRLHAGKSASYHNQIILEQPMLWSPDTPTLYNLIVRVRDDEGNAVDGYRQRIGIRSVEFKGKDGFWLNGKPYESPLIGANRHQDFAIVGNAVPNSIHWRDAKKLRDAGLKVIRNAHCPQDPAFMDACDELGLFVIVNTPGWQFWNDAPEFAQRVYSDIRNMVRRDRNHPCVWLWEPVLNETWYPADFARKTKATVDEEYPYPYCYSGCDSEARGHEEFPMLFAHPGNMDPAKLNPEVAYFTREWGDNVDDWNSHNSPSRVARNWGEHAMLIQAQHYAAPDYQPFTCYDALHRTSRQHVGGCLWHSFDHQRGYHPDPFYGGLMDVFRQPKYSYYMFKAQRSPEKQDCLYETGPMVYIAHEMTPFSPKDVTVYSNCDEVRLTVFKEGKQYIYHKKIQKAGMPSPIIIFENVYDFMQDKALSRKQRQDEVFLLAEGLIGNKVVATHERRPSRRPEKLLLYIDNEETVLEANGSDIVTVVAALADKNGNIKRLSNYNVKFEIEGEGRILGNADIMANPAPLKWGTAPILVQSTLKPGKIKIVADVMFEGIQRPVSAELVLESHSSKHPLVYDKKEAEILEAQVTKTSVKSAQNYDEKKKIERLQRELNSLKLKEVELQQQDFGEKGN